MKNFTLSLLFFCIATAAYSTTWTVVNSGFTFSPATLTILEGDTVIFNLASEHNSTEVSQATWMANGTTPLPGGWQTPFGGGMVLPADLTVGTHWYVCQPHAPMGMKGMIIVSGTTSIEDNPFYSSVSIYPNPSHGNIQLSGGLSDPRNFQMEIYDIQGVKVYATNRFAIKSLDEIEVPTLEEGVYIVRLQSDEGLTTRKVIVQR